MIIGEEINWKARTFLLCYVVALNFMAQHGGLGGVNFTWSATFKDQLISATKLAKLDQNRTRSSMLICGPVLG
ncbi:hypothetical protein MIMGU_mgv1a021346mg [Erythranthe guttata]|uniref:Uncharacterized protein n=1 Tax=Erythranthe guttata TaxID=4155 RepID=A0A022QT05_ERYGU|nr:hypothetical protein MIMGU_mgv1a021346mg [Erythranthe guttata]